jgi:hypothetical protein
MPSQKKTSPATIALAWILVCVPLSWGVYNTALGAAKLFTHLHQNPPAQNKAS